MEEKVIFKNTEYTCSIEYGEIDNKTHFELEEKFKDRFCIFFQDDKPCLAKDINIKNASAKLKSTIENKAQEYLKSTDWYVLRLQETSKAIPDHISKKRAEARDAVSMLFG